MLKQVGKSALWGLLYVVSSTIGVFIALIFTLASNLDVLELEGDAFMETWMSYVMEAAVPGTFIASIICVLVYCLYRVIRKYPAEWKKIEFSKAIFCLALGLVFNLVVTYFLEFIWDVLPANLTESATNATAMLDSDYHWAFLLLAVGIVTPLSEEIIFRHGFCRTLAKGNISMGIILSSFLFGMAHGNLIQGIYTFIMGIMCAVVLLNTDNLWYPSLIHIGLNSSSVFASSVPENFADIALISVGFIGVLICSTMLIHNNEIRALLAKPRMTPVSATQNAEEDFVEAPVEQ